VQVGAVSEFRKKSGKPRKVISLSPAISLCSVCASRPLPAGGEPNSPTPTPTYNNTHALDHGDGAALLTSVLAPLPSLHSPQTSSF